MFWQRKLHFKTDCLHSLFHFGTSNWKRITERETIVSPRTRFSIFIFYIQDQFFALQNPHTFCITKTLLCIHKLEFKISKSIVKFKTNFLLLKKDTLWNYNFVFQTQNQKLYFDVEIAFLHSKTIFPHFKFKKHILFKNCAFRHSKPAAELWHWYNSIM